MNLEIVRADSSTDAIIWLVLGFFWLIAQAIAKLRGGNKPPRPPPPILTEDRSIEEDLRKLFEEINSQQQPPAPPPPAPPPIAKPMRPVPYGTGKRVIRPAPPPKHKATKPFVPPQPAPLHAPAMAERTLEIADIPTISMARARGGLLKESMFGFSAIKTPLPAGKPISVGLMGTGAHLRQLIKGRKQLKQAMVSRIVLGPPKAFSD